MNDKILNYITYLGIENFPEQFIIMVVKFYLPCDFLRNFLFFWAHRTWKIKIKFILIFIRGNNIWVYPSIYIHTFIYKYLWVTKVLCKKL
jgi:hypothetical protein